MFPLATPPRVAHVCFVHVTMQMCCVGGPAGMVAQHPRFEWLGALEHQLTVSVPKGVRWGPPLSRKQRRTEVDHSHGFILLRQPSCLGFLPFNSYPGPRTATTEAWIPYQPHPPSPLSLEQCLREPCSHSPVPVFSSLSTHEPL